MGDFSTAELYWSEKVRRVECMNIGFGKQNAQVEDEARGAGL